MWNNRGGDKIAAHVSVKSFGQDVAAARSEYHCNAPPILN
jgi:hypothetical protein